MEITPEDLEELQKSLESYVQYLPIVKSLLESGLPPLMDALRPVAKELLDAQAEIRSYQYRKLSGQYKMLQGLGFSKTQAFDLLLSHEVRMERYSRSINIPNIPKIETEADTDAIAEKVSTGLLDKLLKRN